jgi:RimJ/RimL family protein N-acetyltransferase
MCISLTDLPSITTRRLRLRPLREPDAEAFRRMTDEPSIVAAVHFLRAPFLLADAIDLIRGRGDGRDCFRGVWRKDDETLVGAVGTHLREGAELEIGYWFSSSARGQGVASEAVGAVVQAVKTAWSHRRLYAECRTQNASSWCLLERLGFRADGTNGARAGRKKLMLL